MSTRSFTRKTEGAAANDTRRDQQRIQRTDAYVATTISFTATSTIADSGNGLARFAVGARIRVWGSPLNSRIFVVTASAAGSLTVQPAMVQTEAAGATISIMLED